MTAPQPSSRRSPISPFIVKLSVGIACAVFGVVVELGLDQVVAVAPWLIIAFATGLVAAILGGIPGGLAAAAIGFAAETTVVPTWIPATASLDGVGWQIDLAVALAGLLVGLWIRRLILGPGPVRDVHARTSRAESGSPAGAPVRDAPRGLERPSDADGAGSLAPAAGADPVGAAAAVAAVAAVRDIGSARTAVQIADALARHAAALCGAPAALVYLRRPGAEELVARGRFGAVDPSEPERLPADRPRPPPAGITELRIGRGTNPIGILRLATPEVAGSHGARAAAAAPLVELITLVAADAIERSELVAARRSSDGEASTSAGTVTILARLAAELVGAATVEEVGRTLADLAVDDLRAGFAVVHVPDRSTGQFHLVHARGYPAGLLASESVIGPDASGPVTRAARDGSVVDVAGEDGWRDAFPAASNVPAITGVRAITAIPMHSAGTLQGVLVIGWRTAADRAAADRSLLATAADQGAQALERALLHAHDEDARRLQEAFIAVVSHELRTPITTILAGSRILRRRLDGDAPSAELSDDIVAEADRLSRIVDDLLVLSRLERRHLTLGDEPVHLDHLLARVVRSEAERWPGHDFILPPLGSHVVRGDETYLEQVVRNLISNAAKYSPEGSPVEVLIEEAPDGELRVRVLDRGAGVAPAEVDELFSLFYRSASTAASAAGAGIGLFVSRRLVAEMGGRMWAEPRAGGGSEFGFSLVPYPADDGDAALEWQPPTAAEAGARTAELADGAHGRSGRQ